MLSIPMLAIEQNETIDLTDGNDASENGLDIAENGLNPNSPDPVTKNEGFDEEANDSFYLGDFQADADQQLTNGVAGSDNSKDDEGESTNLKRKLSNADSTNSKREKKDEEDDDVIVNGLSDENELAEQSEKLSTNLHSALSHYLTQKARPAFSKLQERIDFIEQDASAAKAEGSHLRNRLMNLKGFSQKMEAILSKKGKTVDASVQVSVITTDAMNNKRSHNLPLPQTVQGTAPSRAPSSQAPRVPPPSMPTLPTPKQNSSLVVRDTTKVAQVKVGDVIDLTDEEDVAGARNRLPTATSSHALPGNPASNGGAYAQRNQVQFMVPAGNYVTLLQDNIPQQNLVQQRGQALAMTGRGGNTPTAYCAPTPRPSVAPLPPKPYDPPNVAGLNLCPVVAPPILSISKVNDGVCLQWDARTSQRQSEATALYEVYSYAANDHDPAANNANSWKKVGEVSALPLPMACTLTHVQSNNTYFFIVRSTDKFVRYSDWSNVVRIHME